MFADPTVRALVVVVDATRHNVSVGVLRWTLAGVVEVVAAHDAWVAFAMRMSQHEGSSFGVKISLLEVQDHRPARAVPALIVVVVDENEAVARRQESALRSPVLQRRKVAFDLPENHADLRRVSELRHRAKRRVLLSLDGLISHVDHFLEEESSSVLDETIVGAERFEAAVDDSQVVRRHMLAGVRPKTGDTEVKQVIHELDDFLSHEKVGLVQVRQRR